MAGIVAQGETPLVLSPEQLLNAMPRIRDLNPTGVEFEYQCGTLGGSASRVLKVAGRILDPRELPGIVEMADAILAGHEPVEEPDTNG